METVVQELRVLREAREALDDQIERLDWALAHGRQPAAKLDDSDSDTQMVCHQEHAYGNENSNVDRGLACPMRTIAGCQFSEGTTSAKLVIQVPALV
jgi:hypothetical protein